MKSLSKFAILLAFQGSLPTKVCDYIDNLVTWNFRDIFISRFWWGHISRHLNFAILQKFDIKVKNIYTFSSSFLPLISDSLSVIWRTLWSAAMICLHFFRADMLVYPEFRAWRHLFSVPPIISEQTKQNKNTEIKLATWNFKITTFPS